MAGRSYEGGGSAWSGQQWREAVDDGTYRGRSRHASGLDYEHSAYALLIDERGRQRVGFPYEQITSELLLADLRALKAES